MQLLRSLRRCQVILQCISFYAKRNSIKNALKMDLYEEKFKELYLINETHGISLRIIFGI